MKYPLFFLFILFSSSLGYAQVNSELPTPQETYSKNSSRLVKLSNLVSETNNGKRNFSGAISNLQWDYESYSVNFDIGNNSFDLDFSNVSNATRSHLGDLIKKNNRVNIQAYAGGSNGMWLIIKISQVQQKAVKK